MHYAFPADIPIANTDYIKRKWLDIPYASISPTQKLDIYLPEEGEGPFPVIMSVHGGAFMGGDKGDIQVVPMLAGLKRGYAVVSINYRLSGEAIFPANIQDVKAGIRWIRANAQKYKLDRDKIAAWGGSAGANLSSLAGTSAGIKEFENPELGNIEQSSALKAVVAWFGPTNFLRMDEQLAETGLEPLDEYKHSGADSPESLVLGKKITKIPELVMAANPETYITPYMPPFYLQHGTKDSIVPALQSVYFAFKIEKIAGKEKVVLELLDGAEHADKAFETAENINKVLNFLDKYMK